ncbi:MAG: hypothetical protein KJO07_16345, partial [Deltaproteobacteria bacterium]|nr:hypothetical protein [Deltaproteobacteria bacterium]
IALGASGSQAGLLTLADVFPASSQALRLDGNTATISNDIAGNGVVKGWAKINSDGTVASCYNCDPAQTNRTSVGVYEVDFTAVGNDIRSRPVLCSPGHAASSSGAAEMIRCVERLGDPSSIFLVTFNSADSQVIDSNFTIVVF